MLFLLCIHPCSRYQNRVNGQLLGKWVWTFQPHKNEPPNLTISVHLGSRRREKIATFHLVRGKLNRRRVHGQTIQMRGEYSAHTGPKS